MSNVSLSPDALHHLHHKNSRRIYMYAKLVDDVIEINVRRLNVFILS